MADEQAFGGCCACSSSTKSKQLFLHVPCGNKTRPSVSEITLEATMLRARVALGGTMASLTRERKGEHHRAVALIEKMQSQAAGLLRNPGL